jgi:uncharacterized protein (TIGR02145 family)
MKSKLLLLSCFSLLVLALNACDTAGSQTDDPIPSQPVVDIDGNTYPTVRIGDQTWMASNLKTTRYRDGGSVPVAADNASWSALTTGARTTHPGSNGPLYNWHAVNDGRGLCPTGWRVPSTSDWNALVSAVGSDAGFKLKGRSGWTDDGNGSDAFGYNGLPGGFRSNGGAFEGAGLVAYWWSSSSFDANNAYGRGLFGNRRDMPANYGNMRFGYSVRCVKD